MSWTEKPSAAFSEPCCNNTLKPALTTSCAQLLLLCATQRTTIPLFERQKRPRRAFFPTAIQKVSSLKGGSFLSESRSTLKWKGPTRTTEPNIWLHTSPPNPMAESGVPAHPELQQLTIHLPLEMANVNFEACKPASPRHTPFPQTFLKYIWYANHLLYHA